MSRSILGKLQAGRLGILVFFDSKPKSEFLWFWGAKLFFLLVAMFHDNRRLHIKRRAGRRNEWTLLSLSVLPVFCFPSKLIQSTDQVARPNTSKAKGVMTNWSENWRGSMLVFKGTWNWQAGRCNILKHPLELRCRFLHFDDIRSGALLKSYAA